MQQEGAEFNPNEMFPKELKEIKQELSAKNVNSFTPMSFNKAGAGNNFLGISPITGREAWKDGSATKSSAVFSVSYQQH